MPDPTFLDIKNATVYQGRNKVFENLSLTLNEGQHTAILGPNGAGKSTLLRLLNQELRPVVMPGSHVKVWGKARWGVHELRSRMGLVSHDLQTRYLGYVTGGDVVRSGFHSSIGIWPNHTFAGGQLERADAVMNDLGIDQLARRPFEQMSTGEQRRFLLARALVHDPDVLILDEPTSGMDPGACFLYLDVLRGLMQNGKTLVLVTHHIHEIPPEVVRVVLVKKGRVVGDGKKEDLLASSYLTKLFGRPLEVVQRNGYFQVAPAG